jgi:type I restriction enzyme S subunit
LTEAGLNESAAKLVPAGAVLLAMYGATVGKTALLGIDATTNQAVCNIIPDPRVADNKFVWYALRSQLPQLLARRVGGAQPNISQKIIRGTVIPLPPLPEQRRIVEILVQADGLRKRRAEADAKAARILPSLFYKMFGDPATREGKGSTEPLGKLVDPQSGGTPAKENRSYWDGNIPWISPKDMKRDFIDDAQDHITQLALDETNIRLVPIDAILIVVRGMILARYVPLAVNVKPVTINQDMKALRVKDPRVSPLYLFAAMKALGQRLHASVGTAAHGTRKLDTDLLLSLPILIPDKQKHSDFVSWFRQFSKCNEKRMQTRPRIERLFVVLLHRAFTGDLTAKWREAHMKEILAEMKLQAKALEAEP